MEKLTPHWTEDGKNFTFRIASDFALQLEKKLESQNMTHAQFATLLDMTEGSVSQFFNNPGNLTLQRSVTYARALGMKVAIVAYEDKDPGNNRGPVNSEIFYKCWLRAGAPEDFFSLSGAFPRIGQIETLAVADNVDYRRENLTFKCVADTRCVLRAC
jgi:hypothetical protein